MRASLKRENMVHNGQDGGRSVKRDGDEGWTPKPSRCQRSTARGRGPCLGIVCLSHTAPVDHASSHGLHSFLTPLLSLWPHTNHIPVVA